MDPHFCQGNCRQEEDACFVVGMVKKMAKEVARENRLTRGSRVPPSLKVDLVVARARMKVSPAKEDSKHTSREGEEMGKEGEKRTKEGEKMRRYASYPLHP